MLNNLEALGRAVRVAGTEAGGDVVMPSLKVRTSTSRACRTPCSSSQS